MIAREEASSLPVSVYGRRASILAPVRTWDVGRFSVDGLGRTAQTIAGSVALVGAASRALAAAACHPRLLHRLERAWASATTRYLGIDLRITGREQIDPRRNYLVLALHEGFADALVVLALGLDVRFVARDELFQWPALGRYLTASRQILIPRAPSRAALRRVYAQLDSTVASGESVVVFPQGSVLGLEVAFARGALRLARRAGLPVLPVVITGTHRVWEHPFTNKLRYGRRVTAHIMAPRAAPGTKREWRLLEASMKDLALHPGMVAPRRYAPERDGYWDGYDFDIDPRFPEVYDAVAAHRAGTVQTPR